jgi:SAM-dependent methyltransferase
VEALPFPDARFDFVLSQFGHMFAPRPDVAVKEMLRVLKPGGTLAFSTWPPELFTGRMFALNGRVSVLPVDSFASSGHDHLAARRKIRGREHARLAPARKMETPRRGRPWHAGPPNLWPSHRRN